MTKKSKTSKKVTKREIQKLRDKTKRKKDAKKKAARKGIGRKKKTSPQKGEETLKRKLALAKPRRNLLLAKIWGCSLDRIG
ncbi:MAG: hypothetical protein Ct9H300mP32_5120 [Verrucomicrobiota bacterium]|nr:MAG: hypothetical protein Ct9H300mP32_5120 [Verrucomicrobiota bacterium]